MIFKALLTLDLDGVSAKQRDTFYEYLKKEKWEKIADIDTAWKCTFSEGVARQNAINTCKNDVKEAARLANIFSVKSVVQVGQGNVEEF